MFKRNLASSAALALVFCAGMYAGAAFTEGEDGARDPEAAPPAGEQASPADYSQPAEGEVVPSVPKHNPYGLPDLHAGLRAVDGCIKTTGAKEVPGKKRLLFAWFEDKHATRRWYYSDMHLAMVDKFFMRNKERDVLKHVPEGVPVMVIASYTVPEGPGQPFPQISIELYTPLEGGFSRGGLFGPDVYKEQFMRYEDYYPEGYEIPDDVRELIERQKEHQKQARAREEKG